MRIASSKEMDSKTVMPLGKISAASDWRASSENLDANVVKLKALNKLMLAAEDCDADALMDVDYSEEVLDRTEGAGAVALKRICATATAVKLKSA
jgi:uncharacterized protein YbjQ (UPF0145 family)